MNSPSGSIAYSTEPPRAVGVYACRVIGESGVDQLEDKFLIWVNSRWHYATADGNGPAYRGTVFGWIGPLPRRLPLLPETAALLNLPPLSA
jgi:hypothetical protein